MDWVKIFGRKWIGTCTGGPILYLCMYNIYELCLIRWKWFVCKAYLLSFGALQQYLTFAPRTIISLSYSDRPLIGPPLCRESLFSLTSDVIFSSLVMSETSKMVRNQFVLTSHRYVWKFILFQKYSDEDSKLSLSNYFKKRMKFTRISIISLKLLIWNVHW